MGSQMAPEGRVARVYHAAYFQIRVRQDRENTQRGGPDY
jgi:hypothetical protein